MSEQPPVQNDRLRVVAVEQVQRALDAAYERGRRDGLAQAAAEDSGLGEVAAAWNARVFPPGEPS